MTKMEKIQKKTKVGKDMEISGNFLYLTYI